jgi:hypothetical protein
MYRMIRLSQKPSELSQGSKIAIVASGFSDSSDAALTAANWVKRYVPDAIYDQQTSHWCLDDREGWHHAIFVESSGPIRNQSA